MGKVDWSAKYKRWSNLWGHVMDPKSLSLVVESKEAREERIHSQLSLPTGPGAHEIVREELKKEMAFVGRLFKAIESDTLEEFDEEIQREEKEVEAEKSRKKNNKKLASSNLLSKLGSEKAEESKILEEKDNEEDSTISTCKRCYKPEVVDGQVGLHRCS